MGRPLAYLITFTCYGSRLPGADPGSVDRDHNLPSGPYAQPNDSRWQLAQQRMTEEPYLLDEQRRQALLEAIQETCSHRGWDLLTAHARTNHVHAVVAADAKPEAVLHDFKAYATRALNQVEPHRTKRWARHGSTRYLWTEEGVRQAIRYVLHGQGEPMAVFPALRQAAP